ncbi:FkbM family methyltransferase [Phenylobacterium hankyongense]|uniref:FkbM family methyltransferase n=1 Tax=Phenylobacterium hankyongense TaxID=1813876 RepID=UPI0010580C90|nr:FkbM family methyltransferase [Phenylobacterium hankyongense]
MFSTTIVLHRLGGSMGARVENVGLAKAPNGAVSLAPGVLARLCAAFPVLILFLRAYNKATGALWPRRTSVTYFGARMECDTRDLIQGRIAHFGVWEPDVAAVFHDVIRPGDVVVDVGANIGFFTLLSAKLVGETGGVVAIEASPPIAERLQRHVAMNDLKNVRVAAVAVSDAPGELVLYAGPTTNIGKSTTVATRGFREQARVPALPLDQILTGQERAAVSLIKIDIEGAEGPVLNRLLDTLDLYPRRLSVLVEASADEAPETWHAIFDRFRAAGFTARAVRNRYDWDWYLNWRVREEPQILDNLPNVQTDIFFSRQ